MAYIFLAGTGMHMHDVFSPGHCLHGPLLMTATRAHLVVLAGTECRQLVPVAGKLGCHTSRSCPWSFLHKLSPCRDHLNINAST